jgi:hypothetical protein
LAVLAAAAARIASLAYSQNSLDFGTGTLQCPTLQYLLHYLAVAIWSKLLT